MSEFADIILRSGRSGVELALFVLLPVMVVMLSMMRILEAKGVLDRLVAHAAPLLRPFGIPGLGVFALLQISFVSFAAPIATLAMMDKGGTSSRHIAATLAMVFAMAQANVVFPLAAFGLNVGATLAISLVAGIVAAALTYHVFGRHLADQEPPEDTKIVHPTAEGASGVLAVINRAGAEAFRIAVGAIPLLILALVVLNGSRDAGLIESLQSLLAPLFSALDLSTSVALPVVTKAIAGGSAMMGVSVDLITAGALSATDLNRIAGLLAHPVDVAGVAILISAGPRVAAVMRPALYGAGVAIVLRAAAHFFLF